MGIARIRKLHQLGEPVFKGTVRREPPEPLHCRKCGREVVGAGDSAICGRCAPIEQRIAETGSANKRLINRPKRALRRARKGSAA